MKKQVMTNRLMLYFKEHGVVAMGIMEQKREEMKKEFLALTPLQRLRVMNIVFNDIIALKAKTEGVKEYEVYRRYIKTYKQHS